jgi:hypothetical protein
MRADTPLTSTARRAYAGVVTWDTTGVWVMLALACALGVIGALRAKFAVAERPHIRQAPMPFLGACIDALMTGLGLGMAAVFLILMLAAAFNALQI